MANGRQDDLCICRVDLFKFAASFRPCYVLVWVWVWVWVGVRLHAYTHIHCVLNTRTNANAISGFAAAVLGYHT